MRQLVLSIEQLMVILIVLVLQFLNQLDVVDLQLNDRLPELDLLPLAFDQVQLR